MKRPARYLVRLENSSHVPVTDYAETRKAYKEMLLPLDCTVNSTRISSIAIEVDFFSPEAKNVRDGIGLLESSGKVLSITDLMAEEEPGPAELVMSRARELFNEERFWEVHETVEGIWHRSQGKEKTVQQSIILYASALVHYQKNEPETTLRMLARSLEKMKWDSSSYLSFDLARMRKEAELMMSSGKVHIFRL